MGLCAYRPSVARALRIHLEIGPAVLGEYSNTHSNKCVFIDGARDRKLRTSSPPQHVHPSHWSLPVLTFFHCMTCSVRSPKAATKIFLRTSGGIFSKKALLACAAHDSVASKWSCEIGGWLALQPRVIEIRRVRLRHHFGFMTFGGGCGEGIDIVQSQVESWRNRS